MLGGATEAWPRGNAHALVRIVTLNLAEAVLLVQAMGIPIVPVFYCCLGLTSKSWG